MSPWLLFNERSAIAKCVYSLFLYLYMFLVPCVDWQDRFYLLLFAFPFEDELKLDFSLFAPIHRNECTNVYAYGKRQSIFHIRQMSHNNWSVQCTVTKDTTNSYPFCILYARFLINFIQFFFFLLFSSFFFLSFFIWWWFAFYYYNIQ